jgi:hypothetical protein
MSTFDRPAVEFAKNAAPKPLAHLLFHADFLPSITELGQNGRERYELCLIREVAI